MAKSNAPPMKKENYPYPSIFGSHESMVKADGTAALTDRTHPMRVTLTAWSEYHENHGTRPEGKNYTVFFADLDDSSKVVLEDEYGFYTTQKSRLDNGCADPNRYRECRLERLFEKKEKKE